MFGSIIQDMVIDMNEARLNTVGQLVAFLEGTPDIDFRAQGTEGERYAFIASVVARLAYRRLGRIDKGVVRRYLGRTTGYSRQQLTRLIGRCLKGHTLAKRYRRPKHGFPPRTRRPTSPCSPRRMPCITPCPARPPAA